MTGPQTEVEIRVWCDEVARSRKRCASPATAMDFADNMLAAYRARYGQPPTAADDKLGRAAIETMDAILGAMREDREDVETLIIIERAVQHYMGQRWAIHREAGK